MRRFLFNCTTNVVGGGAKNSAIFVKNALNDSHVFWTFLCSKAVVDLLNDWGIKSSKIIEYPNSPARSFLVRRQIKQFVSMLQPELVFTMAGPAYIEFPCVHVMGISNPYITHASIKDMNYNKSFIRSIFNVFDRWYKIKWSVKADHFIFQTKSSRDGFLNRTNTNLEDTSVIGNAVDIDSFKGAEIKEYSSGSDRRKILILCPAAPYSHKALHIIPDLASLLRNSQDDGFAFKLTLPFDSSLWLAIKKRMDLLGVSDLVVNEGPFKYHNIAEVYKNSDIVFVPSIVETFSATYLEAFAAKRPLVVADREFARDICQKGAIYVEPHDLAGTAEVFNSLLSDLGCLSVIAKRGSDNITCFDSQVDRFEAIIDLLLSCHSQITTRYTN